MRFRQPIYEEPLIYELKSSDYFNYQDIFENIDIPEDHILGELPESVIRDKAPEIPDLPEIEISRHYNRLSRMNFSVDLGIYPLGSCTMKYNPKLLEAVANLDGARWIHPLQPEDTVQGALALLYTLDLYLREITGMDKFTLQPAAGAQGELTGTLIIRAYHADRGEEDKRDEMLIPDSAHGTNPASAAMAGFKVVTIPSNSDGTVDLEALKVAVSDRTAGFMITNPNTLGIFEDKILEIAEIIHNAGGLMYYDGANLNGILGIVRPGDMGFDIVHLNLHKTFGAPHGGGGPGAGPVGVKNFLKDYLPIPTIEFNGTKYYLNYDIPKTIGMVRGFYGNFLVLIKSLAYILLLGGEGLREIALRSVKNTNTLIEALRDVKGIELPYNPKRPRKHECCFSLKSLKANTGIGAYEVAKRLLDYGVHSPTIYFPLIVEEAMLIELPETESLERVKQYAEILKTIIKEAYEAPEVVRTAPHNTSIGRLDEAKASRPATMALTWRMYKKKFK